MSDTHLVVDVAAVLLVLSGLALLGTGRVTSAIRLIALQGGLIAVIALVSVGASITARSVALAAATFVLKSVVFPRLLVRAQREAGVHEELSPFVSYPFALTGGVVALGVAVWLSSRVALPSSINSLVVAVGFFLTFAGLLVLVTRRIALGQVLGYITLENGIAAFGLAVAEDQPLLVELAVLLDVFVAVFVLGIAIGHISRAFDHIEVDQLTALRD